MINSGPQRKEHQKILIHEIRTALFPSSYECLFDQIIEIRYTLAFMVYPSELTEGVNMGECSIQ